MHAAHSTSLEDAEQIARATSCCLADSCCLVDNRKASSDVTIYVVAWGQFLDVVLQLSKPQHPLLHL